MSTGTQATFEKRIGYSGSFLERSGVEAAELAEKLVQEPERPLNEDGKRNVRDFEIAELSQNVDHGATLEDVLRMPMTESDIAPLFFAEGIINGQVQLPGVTLPAFSSANEVYRWVASSGLDERQLRALSAESTKVYKANVVKALVENRPIDESTTEAKSLVVNPEQFIRQIHHITAARQKLLDWRADAPRGKDADDAKLALNSVMLAKVNTQLATGIPMVEYLREQAELTDNTALSDRALSLVSPALARAMEQGESRHRLFRRLDFLRNGIGYGRDGHATSVSAELTTGSAEAAAGGIFTREQMQAMKQTMLSPQQMKQIFEAILARAGQLSGEDAATYAPGRKNRAGDNLFQVVTNTGSAAFSADSISGTYKIPSESRSLYDVMIVGGFHELEHINQAIADDAAGTYLRMAKIKGKRVSGLRESGANVSQRQAEQDFFGYRKPYADTYASALKKLEAGGSTGDAIKAFYDAKLRAMPDTDKTKAAAEAADRVLRLIRGGINSQPMVYAEESILMHELSEVPPEAKARALAITGLDLADQAKLHTFGLLDMPAHTSIDWTEHILAVLEPYLAEIRGTDGKNTDTDR